MAGPPCIHQRVWEQSDLELGACHEELVGLFQLVDEHLDEW